MKNKKLGARRQRPKILGLRKSPKVQVREGSAKQRESEIKRGFPRERENASMKNFFSARLVQHAIFCLFHSASPILAALFWLPFPADLFWLSFPGCSFQAVLSWLPSPGYPVQSVPLLLDLFWLSHSGCLVIRVSCYRCPVLVLFFLPCPGCLILAILCWQPSAGSPLSSLVLASMSWQPYPGSPVLAVLLRLFCSPCPPLVVLFQLSNLAALFWLSSPFCSALAILENIL